VIRFRFDINVLIALIDSRARSAGPPRGLHPSREGPGTESGVMRVVGHPRYPNSPGSPTVVAHLLASLRVLPGHAFWAEDLSLLDREHVDRARPLDSTQVTDS